jgi:DnaJ-class molecular chaperone
VSAHLILLVIAALGAWGGSLYVRPFGRCGKCGGRGTIRSGKRRVKVCPRCKGRRRVQRTGSRTVHRAARRIRHGRQAAARYQEDTDGTP